MSRLKKCQCDNTEAYTELFVKYKSCRKCKHSFTKSKSICRVKFMWFFYQKEYILPLHRLHRAKIRHRHRMITKYSVLYDKMVARKEIKLAIADYGYLPTRKEILSDKQIEDDMAREWTYLGAGIRGVY